MASNKLRKASQDDGEELKMDMSPMIDMVFLLLIFFIVVSSPMHVKQDPKVNPSVAYESVKPEDKNGRIVINIRKDGSYRELDFEKTLDDEAAITEYVRKNVDQINSLNLGYKPKLHIRGDKDAVFKYAQRAIQAASAAEVNKVIFSVYPFAKD